VAGPRLNEFNSQDLANTVWAFATAGVEAPQLFEGIAAETGSRLKEFNSQNLANMAWAFATAGVEAPELFEAIAAEAVSRLNEFDSQGLANIAWALACFNCLDLMSVEALLRRLAEVSAALCDVSLSQLHQFVLFLRMNHAELVSRYLSASELARLRMAFTSSPVRPSSFQREVSAALGQLGWTHEFEHVTEDGLSLDLAQSSSRLAIEVDGPSHYLRNPARGCWVENGATRLKSRLLRGLGWKVTRIPFFEWDSLTTETAKRTYLEGKLGSRL